LTSLFGVSFLLLHRLQEAPRTGISKSPHLRKNLVTKTWRAPMWNKNAAPTESNQSCHIHIPKCRLHLASCDVRKQQAGDETPLVNAPPKQLYQVLEQTAPSDNQSGAAF
jgi:hypothetical protein